MKKLITYLLLLIMTLSIAIGNVEAKNYLKDLFQTDERLKINEQLDGTSFLGGNKVIVNKPIKGIGFILGEEIELNSNQEYIFAAGFDIKVNSNINKDIFVYGEETDVKDVTINRDAYIAGTNLEIDGNIGRNAYLYGSKVELKGTIKGNVYINALEIKIDESAEILGTLKYNENAIITGLKDNIKTKTYEINNKVSFVDFITTFVTGYIQITLLAFVLVYLFDKLLKKITNELKNKKNIFSLIGKGFLVLIGVPIISLTIIMTGLLMPIGIIILILYGIILYISEIITAYIIAYYLDKKYLKRNLNKYILIIIGIFIVRILSIIPIIGGFISFLIILLGLGTIFNIIYNEKK